MSENDTPEGPGGRARRVRHREYHPRVMPNVLGRSVAGFLLAASSLVASSGQLPAQTPPGAAMEAYAETIEGDDWALSMVPVPGGTVVLGSPEDETGRRPDEAPRREVEIEPFWMSTVEIPWDLYHVYMLGLDLVDGATPTAETLASAEGLAAAKALGVDGVARPTPPYRPMDFGMGVEGFPAIGMTQFAARQFTRWLSERSGRFYRLPTEAEWEHACRAGTTTAYGFGDDPADLPTYGWFRGNSAGRRYHPVGGLAPNAWGLHDLHGNVAEWVLDQYHERYPEELPAWPTELYPRVVRGGSYLDEAADLRCAARRGSSASWKRRDPQLPQSIWYHTDARWVGFRVVRPLREPSAEERERAWEADVDSVRRIVERQRRGER